MEDDILDEEFSLMFHESDRSNTLDSGTFRKPVKNLKSRKPVTVDVGQSVQEALTLMQVKQVGCVLVIRGTGLAGILTERDIVTKALGGGKDLREIKVEDVMT